jgi:hypothetical protein
MELLNTSSTSTSTASIVCGKTRKFGMKTNAELISELQNEAK